MVLQVTPQTEHEQCQNERHLSSCASTENQNGLFHTHKFNPKMLCHCRELEGGWGRGDKKQKTRLRAAPSNIEVEQVQIGITQHLSVIVTTTCSVPSKTRHKHATHTSNHTTYQYHYITTTNSNKEIFDLILLFTNILLVKLQYSALA